MVQATYGAAIAAVIAYFDSNDYVLASALLTHARDNENTDGNYTPVNTSAIQASSVYSDVKKSSDLVGTGTFKEQGESSERDLYFAIKSASGGVIVIDDRYDFDKNANYDGVAESAIKMMYKAQAAGVLVPFYTHIVFDETKTASSNPLKTLIAVKYDYTEQVLALAKGEEQTYWMQFYTPGTKVIQTFGAGDVKLEAYTFSGELLPSDDDSGYNLNSLISHDFQATVIYKLKVKFYGANARGSIKIAITTTNALEKYESIGFANRGKF